MNKYKTKCNFCKYFTGRSCMVNIDPTKNSYYCRDALDEFYRYLETLKRKKR